MSSSPPRRERSWQEAFKPPPPPPPPLSAPAPAAVRQLRTSEEEPINEAAPVSPDSTEPAPGLHPARVGNARRGVPRRSTTARSHEVVEQASIGAATPTAGRAEQRVRAALARTLAQLELSAQVADVARGPTGFTATLDLTGETIIDDVRDAADHLAQVLRAARVRVTAEENQVRIEPSGRAVERSRQVAVWVPKRLRDAVEDRKETGVSYTEFVLDAFNRHHASLGSFFVRRLPTAGPMPQRHTRHRRGLDTPVQVWLYLTPAQEAVLDEAVTTSGAGSRSALVTRFLEEELGIVTTPRYSG